MDIEIFNRQRAITVDLARLKSVANCAAARCIPEVGDGFAVLGQLERVEVSVVSDRVIAQIHQRFLNLPGPTDVITFNHGEIFISATTAAKEAVAENESTNRELARYIIHGLLHLNGHLDKLPDEAAKMWHAQELVLQEVWPQPATARQRPGMTS